MIASSIVHRLGFRFRLHYKKLPGKPDIVLPRHKKNILVHGCFWHNARLQTRKRHAENECRILADETLSQRHQRQGKSENLQKGKLEYSDHLGMRSKRFRKTSNKTEKVFGKKLIN